MILSSLKLRVLHSLLSLDLPEETGLELWSQDSVVDFIMDLTEVPMQIVSGAKVGMQAVFMKL
jgi:hypothetical protein